MGRLQVDIFTYKIVNKRGTVEWHDHGVMHYA